ncbi:MFS transporter [Kribbella sp. VKM Ac-2568]|nr:MFS transporter [Kribbella sp. VKM Ac-2568]
MLFAHPVLRPLTISATIGAVAGAMQGPLVVLYLVRELHWSPALVGVAITVAGAASVLGAAVAPAYSNRLGLGRAYFSGQILASLGGVLLALAATPLVFLAQLFSGLSMPLYGVPQQTLRQSLVPESLLGQTTATWRTLVIGGQTLGALTSGLLAGVLGLRLTLTLSTTGMLLGTLPVALSPLRQLSSTPAASASEYKPSRTA